MKLVERIRIRASAEAVWAHVGDPRRWIDFHPSVARVEQRTGSGPTPEAWYEIDFEMKGKRLLHRAQVREVQPPRRLHLAATCQAPPEAGAFEARVDIGYDVSPVRDGVEVRETFDIRGHRMPWFVVLLIQLLRRFGKPVEATALQRLKALIEA